MIKANTKELLYSNSSTQLFKKRKEVCNNGINNFHN